MFNLEFLLVIGLQQIPYRCRGHPYFFFVLDLRRSVVGRLCVSAEHSHMIPEHEQSTRPTRHDGRPEKLDMNGATALSIGY